MSKKNLVFMSLALVALSFSSCKTSSYYNEASSASLEPAGKMVVTPLIADLELIKNAKVSFVKSFSFTKSNKLTAEQYKKQAFIEMAQEYKADVIAGAVYTLNMSENQCVISISGYPAIYKNIRNAEKGDVWILEHAKTETESTSVDGAKSFLPFMK